VGTAAPRSRRDGVGDDDRDPRRRIALGAPLIAHLVGHDPATQYRETGLTPDGLPVGPSRRFLLGTDNLGRDLFIRVV